MVKSPTSDNAIIKKALEAVAAIEEEAEKKKREQLATLEAALEAIKGRITELLHQEQQLLTAIERITGKPAAKKPRTPQGGAGELRQRVARWINDRPAGRFSAGEIKAEFPEINANVGLLLRPLLESGAIRKEGDKAATRYMAAAER